MLLQQFAESFGTGIGAHAPSCITFPVFCTAAEFFKPVELVKGSVNGARASGEGATVGLNFKIVDYASTENPRACPH
jgi:hypothetical protein